MDDIAQKATAIVHGRVLSAYTVRQGSTIYTHYQVQVLERWKGAARASEDVALPGGAAAGYRQSFAGIPQLTSGKEYVMFLWTGPTGVTQIVGFSQGVYEVANNASGQPVASRNATSEMMLDSSGRPVQDQAVRMTLREMSSKIASSLARKSVAKKAAS